MAQNLLAQVTRTVGTEGRPIVLFMPRRLLLAIVGLHVGWLRRVRRIQSVSRASEKAKELACVISPPGGTIGT